MGSRDGATCVRRRAPMSLARKKCTNLVATITAVVIAELETGYDDSGMTRAVKAGDGACVRVAADCL